MAQPLFDADEVGAANLTEMVEFTRSGTVSKTLLSEPAFKQVLFAMDAGQELSEHQSPYLALVHVLDGRLRMRVGGQDHVLGPASWLSMPPHAPHAAHAEQPTRFLLSLIKTEPGSGD